VNYIQHTRAAHEHLSARPEARPHHVSLYWALFYQWNAARFAPCLDLDHQATMQAARIGNERTYRARAAVAARGGGVVSLAGAVRWAVGELPRASGWSDPVSRPAWEPKVRRHW